MGKTDLRDVMCTAGEFGVRGETLGPPNPGRVSSAEPPENLPTCWPSSGVHRE